MIDSTLMKKEVLFTLILLVILFTLNYLLKRAIKKFGRNSAINMQNRKIIFYINNLISYNIACACISMMCCVNLEEFFLFITSILTFMRIGFLPYWSILSNLTANLILLSSHPFKM